jgi:hypothetical protein
VALDLQIAHRAGALPVRHYNARTCVTSLADAMLLASATEDGRIATPIQQC